MPVTASTLVQETARAQQVSATAPRGVGPSPRAATSGEAAGGFAGLLQSMSGGSQSTALAEAKPAGPSNASNASTRRTESGRSGSLAARTTTLASGASEPSARDGATPGRPAGTALSRSSSSSNVAAKDAAATDEPSEAAQADAREASATGADNLAQWLMQMGLIPSQTAANAGEGVTVGASSEAAASADPASGPDAAVGDAGAAGSAAGSASVGARGGRAFCIPGATGSPGGEGPSAGAAKAAATAGSAKDSAGADTSATATLLGAAAPRSGHDGAVAAIDLSGLASAASAAAALASGSPSLAAATPTAAAGGSASVQVQAAFEDPALAGELLLHVGRFAREGLTEASLHLNPAEMGPIRVQIALDGQQARIDFSAQHAATRDLLESTLPALAQSLAADGLTLSASSVQAPNAVGATEAAAPSATAAGLAAQGQSSGDASGRSSAQDGRDERGAGAGDALRTGVRLAGRTGHGLGAPSGEAGRPEGAAAAAGLRALDLYA